MPLITAHDLLAGIEDENLTVIDSRWYLGKPAAGAAAYAAGHIPGSFYADLESDLSAHDGGGRHPLPAPEQFDATLRRWDVNVDSTVVVYDDRGGAIAARLWWMLTEQGHLDTYILDGGLQAWQAVGGQLSTDTPAAPSPPAHSPIEVTAWTGTVERSDVGARADGVVVADARSADRYRGETEPIDSKAGHIPGAISFPMTTNLDRGHFKSAGDLRSAYAAAGIEDGSTVIMHCGSGVTACHNVFAMEVAGLGRPNLYVGSWSDWSSSDQPIATGPEPG
jgi:thiosulfate/3-mercaptopyruvate sulfurtransferase